MTDEEYRKAADECAKLHGMDFTPELRREWEAFIAARDHKAYLAMRWYFSAQDSAKAKRLPMAQKRPRSHR